MHFCNDYFNEKYFSAANERKSKFLAAWSSHKKFCNAFPKLFAAVLIDQYQVDHIIRFLQFWYFLTPFIYQDASFFHVSGPVRQFCAVTVEITFPATHCRSQSKNRKAAGAAAIVSKI